jgi:hypothetical protein
MKITIEGEAEPVVVCCDTHANDEVSLAAALRSVAQGMVLVSGYALDGLQADAAMLLIAAASLESSPREFASAYAEGVEVNGAEIATALHAEVKEIL